MINFLLQDSLGRGLNNFHNLLYVVKKVFNEKGKKGI
jgi:hypothetical protein